MQRSCKETQNRKKNMNNGNKEMQNKKKSTRQNHKAFAPVQERRWDPLPVFAQGPLVS